MSFQQHKTVPELRVMCWPRTAIPYRGALGHTVVNLMGDRMAGVQGDGRGLSVNATYVPPAPGSIATVGKSWQAQSLEAAYTDVSDNMEFIRFHKNGRVTEGNSPQIPGPDEVAGWTLKGREKRYDCSVDGVLAGTVALPELLWKTISGTWQSVRLLGGVAAIVNRGSGTTELARTTTQLKANQGAKVVLQFAAKGGGAVPECYLAFGNDLYRVFLSHGQPARVEKRANGDWVILRRLEGSPVCNLQGGATTLSWTRRGGRLVVRVGADSYHFLETRATGQTSVAAVSEWPAGTLTLSATNCRVRAEFSLIEYTNDDGTPQTGEFKIESPRASNAEVQAILNTVAGWLPKNNSVSVPAPDVGNLSLSQTYVLTTTDDHTDAPLVTRAMARFEVTSRDNESPTPIDIGPAVLRANRSQATPPTMSGPELTLEIDRNILSGIMVESYGSADWGPYVDQYCPITFEWRWHYTEGDPGVWIKGFQGYVYITHVATQEANDRTLTLTCHSPIVRLQNPAGMITHRMPPLDMVFAEKISLLVTGGAQTMPLIKVYGGDCVQSILRVVLGNDEGDRLNGNSTYLGDPRLGSMKYFCDGGTFGGVGVGPLSQYALWDATGDGIGLLTAEQSVGGGPPTAGGLVFPAPFGDDAVSWIKQIADMDRGMFFYGLVGDTNDWPSPIYGRISNILSGAFVHNLYDGITLSPDDVTYLSQLDALMATIEVETRPDADLNHFVVWGTGKLGDADDGRRPSNRIGEEMLSGGGPGSDTYDPNAPGWSWLRTLVDRNDLASVPGGAEAEAKVIKLLYEQLGLRWPVIEMEGRDWRDDISPAERPINWGDLVRLNFVGDSTDTTINLQYTDDNGRQFRVERVEDTWEMDAQASMTTKVWVRPLTHTGI